MTFFKLEKHLEAMQVYYANISNDTTYDDIPMGTSQDVYISEVVKERGPVKLYDTLNFSKISEDYILVSDLLVLYALQEALIDFFRLYGEFHEQPLTVIEICFTNDTVTSDNPFIFHGIKKTEWKEFSKWVEDFYFMHLGKHYVPVILKGAVPVAAKESLDINIISLVDLDLRKLFVAKENVGLPNLSYANDLNSYYEWLPMKKK